MKKISLSKIDKIIEKGTIKTVSFSAGEEEISIEVKDKITLEEQCSIVDYVVEKVISANDGHIEYRPELEMVLFAAAILTNYTNLKVEGNIERIDKIVSSPVWDKITEHINYNQYHGIKRAISEKIEFIKSSYAKQIDELIIKINEITANLSELFKDESFKNIPEFVNKIANADEEKIIKNILANK